MLTINKARCYLNKRQKQLFAGVLVIIKSFPKGTEKICLRDSVLENCL